MVGVVGVKILMWVAGLGNAVGEVFVVEVWPSVTLAGAEIIVVADIVNALKFVVPAPEFCGLLFGMAPMAVVPMG